LGCKMVHDTPVGPSKVSPHKRRRQAVIRIALVGDYSSDVPAHRAIPGALLPAARPMNRFLSSSV